MLEKIFFIGSYCPQNYIDELIQSGSSPDNAAINLQGAIINGFEEQGIELDIISIPSRESYPRSKKIFVDSRSIPHNKGEINIIGFINIPILSRLTQFFRIRNYLKKQLKRHPNSKILLYSLYSPLVLALSTLRKSFSTSYVIITDLPQYMSENKNILYRIGKYFDTKLINFCLKKFDGFILLSKEMKYRLPIGNKPYIIIEGIYRGERETHKEIVKRDARNVIMYSGFISKRFNIWELINAFKQINEPTLQLWLCGATDDPNDLSLIINSDSRIKYFGLLPSLKVKEMQQKVGLLINPRFGKGEFTRYSFPSKTMEYLASGTPTMMCNLPSLPKDYEKYLFFIEEESETGIKNSIEKFFRIPYENRNQKAQEAKEFILREKSEIPQTEKIINLMQLKKF